MRLPALLVWSLLALPVLFAQDTDAGRHEFETRCAGCHGGDGNGGELGPAIVPRLPAHTDQELGALIHSGIPTRGMPAFDLGSQAMANLVAFLRTLRPRRGEAAPVRGKAETTDGRTLEGLVLNHSLADMQLRTDDNRIHLLRAAGDRYRPVTSQTDWPTYNGQFGGNRYTTLTQIDKSNVSRLAPKWVFSLANTARLEVTPVVVEGVMYVTSANECYALDAGTGRQIWHYQRPRTRGLIGNAAGGINRGVAVAGDRVFMVTDNAHIIALHRATGALLWETEMADWRLNYNATSAPLAVNGLVVSGTAGGDEGVRGFVAAFDQASGKEVWRFWTTPNPGEPGSETWKGADIAHPGSVAWFTGTFDPELNTLYWPTGNPGNDLSGDEREGDNLYSSSVLALDAKTGKLKWYYQFTPHDVWDWDATEPPVLVDTNWEGQPRKLLLQANRNGFFYVLDRVNGKLLLAKPFVKKLTWAKGIGPDGRPQRNPDQEPTPQGTRICPAMEGAANWFSTSFNPPTGFYYVQTLERCAIYTERPVEWQAGRGYMGGSTRPAPGDTPQKILRAIDIRNGNIAWEVPEVGPGNSWGGVLSTASGLVFFCDDSGMLMAVDASDGKRLWEFQTSQLWRASPMVYVFDGKQHIAVASGPNILSFALVE
jgi:alcohol dehydrogenase (cytochrome c)